MACCLTVGNARDVEHDGLAIHWTLDDFTGSVRCKMYLGELNLPRARDILLSQRSPIPLVEIK